MFGNYLMYGERGAGMGMLTWILPIILFDLVVRGLALWRAARKEQQWWFVALLVINSMGILPVVYLLLYREGKKAKKVSKGK